MAEKISKLELKALGKRIFSSLPNPGDSDMDLLDEYRAHVDIHLQAVEEIVTAHCPNISTRIKTHSTLFDKLHKLDLGKIQDVGGARCVVTTRADQDNLANALSTSLTVVKLIDRRDDPRSGYRAVHIVAGLEDGCPIEIQIRTEFQHEWAQRFEQLADLWGRQIRYGEPPNDSDANCQFGTRQDCVNQMIQLSEGLDSFERQQAQSASDEFVPVNGDIVERARTLFNWIAEQVSEEVEL